MCSRNSPSTTASPSPPSSRAITAITPLLATALREFTPTAEELPDGEQRIVDGTLVTCRTWADHQELYSPGHDHAGQETGAPAICLIGKRSSTPLSTAFAGKSSELSPTSKHGGSCTPTTGDRWPRSAKRSALSSDYTPLSILVNNPPCTGCSFGLLPVSVVT